MKKVKTRKGYVIAQQGDDFYIFTKDTWETPVCRNAGYAEHEAGSIKEAEDWIG